MSFIPVELPLTGSGSYYGERADCAWELPPASRTYIESMCSNKSLPIPHFSSHRSLNLTYSRAKVYSHSGIISIMTLVTPYNDVVDVRESKAEIKPPALTIVGDVGRD